MGEKFNYTYSAKRNSAVEEIKMKYLPQEENGKLLELKKLDRSCERPGMITAIITGMVGAGVFILAVYLFLAKEMYLGGMFIGMVGLFIMAMAVPVYSNITKNRRKKIAPLILKLSEEIERGE